MGVSALVAVAACQDQNIPFYTAPTSVAATPGGIQNAVSGLFAASRQDISAIILDMAAGYGRDGGVWTNTEVRTVQYPMGATSTPTTSGTIWAQEYQNILQAQQIEAVIPSVGPTYSAANQAALLGLVKTLRAVAYMNIAEAHDTAGFAIRPTGTLSAPPAAICVTDAWIYIVALLDSANAELTTAGAIPLPVILPTGFAALQMAGPSTSSGTFASLNRALAAKAMLERAYADNRIAPADTTKLVNDPTLVATPNAIMVDSAATDLAASGMYNEAQLAPPSPSGFSPNAYNIMWDFGTASADVSNPIFAQIGTEATLGDLIASVDTVNDKRWIAKFTNNPNAVQQTTYAVPTYVNAKGASKIYNMSAAPTSTIPFLRVEGLVLLNAQILLGQGNFAGAIAKANLVRTMVGGLAPAAPAATYIGARDFILNEQRISMTWEPWSIRTISLRMYGLQKLADTTWNNPGTPPNYHDAARRQEAGTAFPAYQDFHTTINPVPFTELSGRGEQNQAILTPQACSHNP